MCFLVFCCSGIENRDEVYSCIQLTSSAPRTVEVDQECESVPTLAVTPVIVKRPAVVVPPPDATPASVRPGPVSVTSKVFRDIAAVSASRQEQQQQQPLRQKVIVTSTNSTGGGKLFIPASPIVAKNNKALTSDLKQSPIPVALIIPRSPAVDSKPANESYAAGNGQVYDFGNSPPPPLIDVDGNDYIDCDDNRETDKASTKVTDEAQQVEQLIKTLSETKPFPNNRCGDSNARNSVINGGNDSDRAPRIQGASVQQQRSGPQSSTYKVFAPAPPPPPPSRPTTATSKIFAPKTKDMNKGYLMYSDDESGLTSKYRYLYLSLIIIIIIIISLVLSLHARSTTRRPVG